MAQNAKERMESDCVACASTRPHLVTEPAPLFQNDTWGYNCMMQLSRMATPPNCDTLASIYPPIHNRTQTDPFTPQKGDNGYTCFDFMSLKPQYLLGNVSQYLLGNV